MVWFLGQKQEKLDKEGGQFKAFRVQFNIMLLNRGVMERVALGFPLLKPRTAIMHKTLV